MRNLGTIMKGSDFPEPEPKPKPQPKPDPSNGGKPKLGKCNSWNDCSCKRCVDFWNIGNGICQ